MNFYTGSDHGGIEMREQLAAVLRNWGHDVIETFGPADASETAHHPDVAVQVDVLSCDGHPKALRVEVDSLVLDALTAIEDQDGIEFPLLDVNPSLWSCRHFKPRFFDLRQEIPHARPRRFAHEIAHLLTEANKRSEIESEREAT